MAKQAKKSNNVERIKQMAAEYGCADNALFLTTLDQYIVQQRVIDMIREELDGSDAAISKEYVKGRENLYAHPLIKELPKHSDSANRTAELLLKIITALGDKKPVDNDGFDAFVARREQM